MSDLKKRLLKSLEETSEQVSAGILSDSSLIKQSNIFKWRTNFVEDKNYKIIKAKTFNNFKNNIENDQELMKALILGETKDVNGVLYVVKQVGKSGKLDWRVANKQPKSAQSKTKANIDTLFDTQDFPTKTSDLTFKAKLGGSTGAELMEDSNGNLFVVKKGANPDHIKEEFLTNCLYKVMGASVPTVKLYEENGQYTMLSKFIPNTTPVNNIMDDQYLEDITEFYVLDCLLANWDIYKNDNILIDNNDDTTYRVDNGGGLRFSAQGRDKGAHFTDDVDEIESMLVNNPHLAPEVTTAKINAQIAKILKNKSKLLSLIDDVALKQKMSMRIASLDMRLTNANLPVDPYRELTDKELDKAMKVCKGDLFLTNDVEGWVFLSQIAKMRGFDGTPTVVDKDTFDKMLADKDNILVNRGLTNYNNKSARALMEEFTTSEHCFYGKQAMYGAGIYGAVNKPKTRDKSNGDYHLVLKNYADYEDSNIMDIILTKDMKIIDGNELDDMMTEEFFGDEYKKVKKEYNEAVENLNKLKLDKQKIEEGIEADAKKELGWNEKTYNILKASKPEVVYADTDKFKFEKILKYYTPILASINGKIEKLDDINYNIILPSGSSFILNKNFSEDVNALKQKNAYLSTYNYQYKLLKEFILKEHFHNVNKKVSERITKENRDNPVLKQNKVDTAKAEKEIKTLSDTVNNTKKNGASTLNSVMASIAKQPGGEFRGYYAAIKGYDAIIQKNGWGGKTDFCVILNRNKVIVKDFN